MASLSASRNTPELTNLGAYNMQLGVEASTSIYVGGMVAADANGYAVPAQILGAAPLNALRVLGVCEFVYAGGIVAPGINATNTSVSSASFPNVPNIGSAGAIAVGIRSGVLALDSDGSISVSNVGQLCFAVDDHTVGIADGSGGTTVPNTTSIAVPGAAPLINVLHPYIVPGSFNAYSATGGGGTHYVENTDYAINYQSGLFAVVPGGAIAASGTVFVSYKYGLPTKAVAGTIVQVDSQVWVNFMRQSWPSVTAAVLAN